MSIDIIQKTCPLCGERAIKIDRDKWATRYCACGHSWIPVKNPEREKPVDE